MHSTETGCVSLVCGCMYLEYFERIMDQLSPGFDCMNPLYQQTQLHNAHMWGHIVSTSVAQVYNPDM